MRLPARNAGLRGRPAACLHAVPAFCDTIAPAALFMKAHPNLCPRRRLSGAGNIGAREG